MTLEEVEQARAALVERGLKPSQRAVLAELGRGSKRDVAKFLRQLEAPPEPDDAQCGGEPEPEAAPLDYTQRQALSKQEPFPLTIPPAKSPLETWEVMVANMMAQNPGMSLDAAARSVMQQTGGAEAWERYRQQQLFGRR